MSRFNLYKETIDEEDIYIDCSLPAEMFHYTSRDRLLGILKSKNLYFSHMSYVNDINECMDTFEILSKIGIRLKEIGKQAFEIPCNSSREDSDQNVKIIEDSVDEIMKYAIVFCNF